MLKIIQKEFYINQNFNRIINMNFMVKKMILKII
ncbi:hypothetical protein Mgra_00006573 [Meloidogyne graminicola]|uniref:Uncharacterized protein n=1 Tax=Meloidogyne graminicola TaxID=189291 RepID=A0A8S9ZKX7_9BILA|nr:hypothetical protein Mgra_00006573 [Meloidogyne graminicola]